MRVNSSDISSFAASREISNEIAEAILEMAASEQDATAIWAEPTESQRAEIIERAWELAGADEDELCWGGVITR